MTRKKKFSIPKRIVGWGIWILLSIIIGAAILLVGTIFLIDLPIMDGNFIRQHCTLLEIGATVLGAALFGGAVVGFIALSIAIFHKMLNYAQKICGDNGKIGSDMKNENSETQKIVIVSQNNTIIMIMSKIVIPLLGVIAAYYAYQATLMQFNSQTKLLEMQSQQLKEQSDSSNTQFEVEQFKNAIGLLGSENPTVVLGGVHALHNLAKNSETYRQPVFEVFISFIREETAKPEYQKRLQNQPDASNAISAAIQSLAKSDKTNPPQQVASDKVNQPRPVTSQTVIQTIFDKLFRDKMSKELYQEFYANLGGAFLPGVSLENVIMSQNIDLRYANLQKVVLSGAVFQEVDFEGADLQKAKLMNVKFKEVDFERAKLQKADLSNAELQGADLFRADLREAELSGTKLQKAFLFMADLRGATFKNTKLQGAGLFMADLRGAKEFEDTELQKARLVMANLDGVDLRSVNLQEANLLGANLRGTSISLAKIDNADFRGVQSSLRTRTNNATTAEKGKSLKTDLSGIILYNTEGKKLEITEERKKELFRERGAKVDDLSADEAQKLYPFQKLLSLNVLNLNEAIDPSGSEMILVYLSTLFDTEEDNDKLLQRNDIPIHDGLEVSINEGDETSQPDAPPFPNEPPADEYQ
ncbi:MAG: pentapeptide repeat-containing protein [Planctomycetaceae bacterium]|nr:pentapeptide repeat-containing protein [Planctomycetaceae bacterium]